jgi:hypothetical protein
MPRRVDNRCLPDSSREGLVELAERLGFHRLVLGLRDRTGIQEGLRLRDLIGGRARASHALEVRLLLSLHGISLAGSTLVHARAISDEVHEDRENRQDDEEKDPHSLDESAGLPVSEDIGNDLEQHHQVGEEYVGDRPETGMGCDNRRMWLCTLCEFTLQGRGGSDPFMRIVWGEVNDVTS